MPYANPLGGQFTIGRLPIVRRQTKERKRRQPRWAASGRHVRILDLWGNFFLSIVLFAADSLTACEELDDQAPTVYVVVIDISGSMDYPLPAPIQPQLAKYTKLHEVKRRLAMLAKYLPINSRVLVTTFDHDRFEICDITLSSDQARKELDLALQRIKGRQGSTHLWRTADQELTRAKKIAAQVKDGRVRMLLYTDGDDQEKKPGMDHKWILKKHGKDLKSSVALDWVTLGFDLKKKIKDDLEASGVAFTPVMKPEDIALFRAEFRLSAKSVLVGETVELIDESLGINVEKREVSWGDGSESRSISGRRDSHRFKRAGKFEVTYKIVDKNGKSSISKSTISATFPPNLNPQFEMIGDRFFVGDKIHLVDTTKGNVKGRSWTFDGGPNETARKVSFSLGKAGTKKIALTVIDSFGRKFSTSRSIEVKVPPKEALAIECDRQTAIVGETVILRTKENNSLTNYRWRSGLKTYSGNTLRISFDKAGSFELKLEATDKFGRKLDQTYTLKVVLPKKTKATIVSSHKRARVGEWVTLSFPNAPLETRQTWFVDNDKVAEGSKFRHRFDKIGAKEIRLIVEDKYGQTSNAVCRVSIVPGHPPKATIHAESLVGVVGQPLKLTCPIRGENIEINWEVAGKSGNDRAFHFTPKNPGKFDVQLKVTDRFGQSDTAAAQLTVKLPKAPSADFRYDMAAIGWRKSVTFLNKSSASSVRFQWSINDKIASETADLVFTPTSFGDYKVGLTVWDQFDQKDVLVQNVTVVRPPKPVASFSLGTESAKVGDRVRVTDTSSGDIEKVVFKVDGHEEFTITPPFTGEKKYFDIHCQQAGELKIVQFAYGPGGISESKNAMIISPALMKPTAAFTVESEAGVGPKLFRFINRSTGDAQQIIFDPDDGSPVQQLSSLSDVEHIYEPGTYSPKIKVIAAVGTGFEPSIWQAESFNVAKPMPAWAKRLFWQTPLVILIAVVSTFVWHQRRAIQVAKQESMLAGELVVRPVDKPRALQRFPFPGTSDEEVVELDDFKSLRLYSALDLDDGEINYSAEMRDGEQIISHTSFEPDTEFQVGGFLVRYSA